MSVNIYSPLSGDGLESEELKLYNLVNDYRAQNGLSPIPLAGALTSVANRHVRDLAENIGQLTHSWSDAVYDANNSNTWPAMWAAPQRLNTGYPGNGYENAFGGSAGYTATAEDAFKSWQGSPPHNHAILNQDIWQNSEWNALGVGIYKGYAVLWFGEEIDPTGTLGLDGNDTIAGQERNEYINGNTGSDWVFGSLGNDSVFGGKDDDRVYGDPGDDLLNGNIGNDLVWGGDGNDTLNGGQNNDSLFGEAGSDCLTGDLGFDTLTGSVGNDVFALRSNAGTDVIADYNDAEDLIGLREGLSVANIFITQGAGVNVNDTLINTTGTGEVLAILLDVRASIIESSDFLLV